jgi:hypothetical protein
MQHALLNAIEVAGCLLAVQAGGSALLPESPSGDS